MSNPWLFVVCVFIWGSTWIAITYQLGEVSPVLSVAYRITIAACCLLLFCWWRKIPLVLPRHIHFKMACVGLMLFTLNYTFLYESQHYIVSAVLALMSSLIIYFNVFLRRVLLGKPIRVEVLIGATLGLSGIALIFMPEFSSVGSLTLLWTGIGLAVASFIFASLGNVISERIMDHGTQVMPMNFWAMTYGLVFMYSYVVLTDVEFVIPTRLDYYISLIYLAVFGTVLAFGAYMKLMQQIGSDKSAYVVLMYPIVALVLSTMFEDYQWYPQTFVGVIVVLLGNAVVMGKIPLPFIKKRKNNNNQ